MARSRPGVAAQVRIVATTLGIAQGILVARVGGPEVKGVAAAFIAINLIVYQLANFDLRLQIVRYAKDSGDLSLMTPLLWRAIAGFAAIAAVVVATTAPTGDIVPWIALGSLALLINMYLGVAVLASRGPVLNAWAAVGQQLASIAVVLALAVAGNLDDTTVKIAVIAGYLFPLPLLMAAMPRAGDSRLTWRESFPAILRMTASSLPWHFGQLGQVVVYGSGVLVVGWSLGAEAAGIFSVAAGLARLGQVLSQQVSADAYYRMNSLNEIAFKRDAVRVLLVEGIFAVGLGLLGYWLIDLLYGDVFAGAYALMLVLLPGSAAWGVVFLAGNVIRVYGRAPDMSSYSIPGVVALAVLYFWLTPSLGAMGVAASTTIVMILMSIVAVMRARRVLRVRSSQLANG